jgi:hypothetical protein
MSVAMRPLEPGNPKIKRLAKFRDGGFLRGAPVGLEWRTDIRRPE